MSSLDAQLIERALKRAGMALVKHSGPASVCPLQDLADAIKAEVQDGYATLREAKKLVRAELQEDTRRFMGWDFGCDDFSVAVFMDKDGNVDTVQYGNKPLDKHIRPEPCPVERMEDEGGPPPRDPAGTQDIPKVGMIDFTAITASLSRG